MIRSIFNSVTARILFLLVLALGSILGTAGLFWLFLADTSGLPGLFDKLGKQRMLSVQMVAAIHELDDDPARAREQLDEAATQFEQTLTELQTEQHRERPASPNLDVLVGETTDLWEQTRPAVETLLEPDPDAETLHNARGKILKNGPLLTDRSDAIVQDLRREAEESRQRMWWVMIGLVVFNLGLVLAGWLLSRRWIVRPLERLETAASTLRNGNLEARITSRDPGQFGNLQETFNQMADDIEELVESLEQQRNLAESISEHAPAGVLVHRQGDIIFSNAEISSLTGSEDLGHIDEFLGLFDARQRPDVRTLLYGREDCCGPKTSCRPVEVTVDGETKTLEIVALPIDYGDQRALLSVIRDITDRREFTARMMQMDRVLAVGTLVSGIGHEINNPLSFVLNNVQFVRSRLDKLETPPEELEEVHEALADAEKGAEQIREIVTRLRTFTHYEDETPGNLVDVEAAIDAAIQMARSDIRHRAELETDVDHDLPRVEGDGSRVAQVFLNLLVNAADAVEQQDEGRITVETTVADDRLIVEISDNGCGIDDEVADRMFDPFFTTKSPQRGTGLGLASAQSVVESHDGVLTFESTPGVGTTFRVELPVADSAGPTTTDRQRSRTADGPRRIAVVDDEPGIGRTIERVLGDDHSVQAFASATEFLGALADGAEYDVVFCDLLMPDLTAMDLVPLLEEDHPETARRLVLMTGGVCTPEAEDFVEQTDLPLSSKPIDNDELRQYVTRFGADEPTEA